MSVCLCVFVYDLKRPQYSPGAGIPAAYNSHMFASGDSSAGRCCNPGHYADDELERRNGEENASSVARCAFRVGGAPIT